MTPELVEGRSMSSSNLSISDWDATGADADPLVAATFFGAFSAY